MAIRSLLNIKMIPTSHLITTATVCIKTLCGSKCIKRERKANKQKISPCLIVKEKRFKENTNSSSALLPVIGKNKYTNLQPQQPASADPGVTGAVFTLSSLGYPQGKLNLFQTTENIYIKPHSHLGGLSHLYS